MDNHIKVFAVVVTYKRSEILEECLTSLLENSSYKIHHLFVVINDFEQSTLDVVNQFILKFPSKLSYKRYNNLGPAGGFYYGLENFLESDSDYVWLLDDDIFPDRDCLKELLECSKTYPYIIPTVFDTEGKKVVAFGWWGVLLAHSLVKKVGLPIKEFFYWKEDTEYLQNRMIRKFSVIPHRSEMAHVIHGHINKSKKPSWYYYYTVRNTIYYRTKIFPFNNKGRIFLLKTYSGLIFSIIFKERQKIKKFSLLVLGTKDGIIGKIGKYDALHK
ncbi:glycosyltransferase [Gillisia sp. JM1]|uniref:glycosyltransferase n=1 Tax=Gillisia sp. JM1 TaxID=1283286 RepID=UPI00040205F3|nr:glycosyltransferase [Gillisia sp. JM1]